MRGTGARGGADPPEGGAADGFARSAALRSGWRLAAILLQARTDPCATAVWQRALVRRGVAARLVPPGLARRFTDPALASAAISGALRLARGMQRRGLSPRDAGSAVPASPLASPPGFLVATLSFRLPMLPGLALARREAGRGSALAAQA